jgi:hypothetical protein
MSWVNDLASLLGIPAGAAWACVLKRDVFLRSRKAPIGSCRHRRWGFGHEERRSIDSTAAVF